MWCGRIIVFSSTSSLFINFVNKRIETAPISYKGCVIVLNLGRTISVNFELLAVMISKSSGIRRFESSAPFKIPTANSSSPTNAAVALASANLEKISSPAENV